MSKILLLCLGNICRSPAAEGVLRARARERNLSLTIESAGTGDWHVGDPPDARMITAMARRGYDITHQRGRQVELADFYMFDYLLAMDLRIYNDLLQLSPPNRDADIRLFLDFSPDDIRETPDPYYGGADGFETVIDLIETGTQGFLDFLEDEA